MQPFNLKATSAQFNFFLPIKFDFFQDIEIEIRLRNEERAYFDKLEAENRPQKNVEKHQNKTTPKVISLKAQQHLTF